MESLAWSLPDGDGDGDGAGSMEFLTLEMEKYEDISKYLWGIHGVPLIPHLGGWQRSRESRSDSQIIVIHGPRLGEADDPIYLSQGGEKPSSIYKWLLHII